MKHLFYKKEGTGDAHSIYCHCGDLKEFRPKNLKQDCKYFWKEER